MLKKIFKLIKNHGGFNAILFLFLNHLIISFFFNSIQYFKTLTFHIYKWKNNKTNDLILPGIYMYATNSLFWLYTFDEIKKTKFKKFSVFLGDGNYEMSNLWHLSPISLFLFRNYGVILSFIFITIIPLIFFINGNILQNIILIFFYFSSPVTFSMAFVVGRYHSPAWFLLVLNIIIFHENYFYVSALTLLTISLLSSTVLFIASLVQIWFLVLGYGFETLIVLIPAIIYIFLYLTFIFKDTSKISDIYFKIRDTFLNIGITQKNVKYKKKSLPIYKIDIISLYYLLNFIFFYISMVYLTNVYYFITILAIMLYLLNEKLIRFADTQTTVFFMFISSICDLYIHNLEYFSFILLLPWIIFSYIYKVGSIKLFDNLNVLKPYLLNEITKDINKIFSKLPKNSKLFIAFPNCFDNYEKIFSDYRSNLELLVYSAYVNKLILIPNFYFLFKYNYKEAPNFFVDNKHDLEERKNFWKITHVLIEKKLYKSRSLDLKKSIAIFNENYEKDAYSSEHYKPFNLLLYDVKKNKEKIK